MRSLIVWIVVFAGFSTQALAEDHAVGFRVGMLGLGVEYAYRVSDRISVRGGLNGSGVSFDETESITSTSISIPLRCSASSSGSDCAIGSLA